MDVKIFRGLESWEWNPTSREPGLFKYGHLSVSVGMSHIKGREMPSNLTETHHNVLGFFS